MITNVNLSCRVFDTSDVTYLVFIFDKNYVTIMLVNNKIKFDCFILYLNVFITTFQKIQKLK